MKTYIDKYLQWILLTILVLIWGSSFILMKRTLVFYSNTELGSLRIVFAGLVLLPFAFKRMRGISKKNWFWIIVVGLIGNTFPAFLFAKAQTGIDSSLAGVLNSTTPMFALMVGLLFFKLKAHWMNFVGILIGFIGAVLMIVAKNGGHFDINIQYSMYVVLATLFYAFNLNIIKYKLANIDAITITAMSYTAVFFPILIYLFAGTEFTTTIMQPGALNALIYPAILGVLGSAVAILIFNYLVKLSGVLFTASVTYLIPIVAAIIGVIDGEVFKPSFLIYLALILTGVFLVNKKKRIKN